MKKKNFRFLLSLLLMTIAWTSAWGATQKFTVEYVGRTTSQGAGYTAKTSPISYTHRGWISTTRQVNIQGGYTQTEFTVSGTNADDDVDEYNSLLVKFITPNPVEGYYASVSVSGTTVTITYAPMTIKYRVIWDKEFVPNGGYTLTGQNPANSEITSGDDAEILVIEGQNGKAPATWNDNTNLSTYITPRAVDGYTTGIYFRANEKQLGYEGTIYINYTTTATATVTTDGIYDYSNIYTRETGSVVKLPDDECAISLHLGASEEVTETKVYYRRWYTTNGYNIYYIDDAPLNESGKALPTTIGQSVTIDGATYKHTEVSGFADKLDETYYQYDVYSYLYYYEVTHTINVSTVENAVIPLREPKTLADGSTSAERKVTAIQKWGFCYKMNDIERPWGCEENSDGTLNHENKKYNYKPSIDNHSNWHLKTVKFEKDANGQSNLESIGDYAFMSCKMLTDVDIPFSVKYMGQGIFEMDSKLKNVNFQTGKIELNGNTYNEGVQFNTIRMFTFWKCTAMETLILPDGITDIEGQQAGAALQYMTSLTNLSLPNTLERIGPHFLCCASSLKTLTIPNSVTYIDGASFHGCESLESVYILGPAANLQGEFAEANSGTSSSTFSANTTYCKEAVNNCTFYTTEQNLAGYKNDPVWSRIDNDGEYNPNAGKFGNKLVAIPDDKRWMIPNVWVTAIFPHGVENYIETFGEGTQVAVMDLNNPPKWEIQNYNGKRIKIYDVNFKIINATKIEKDTPVLIKPGKEVEHTFYTGADQQEEWWKTNSTIDFTKEVTATDGAKIRMKGRYLPHQLRPYDFYFMYKNKTTDETTGKVTYDTTEVAKFYRVDDQQNAPMIKGCRCWWQVWYDGMQVEDSGETRSNIFRNDDPTGIDDIDEAAAVRVNIYDINGRKLNIDKDQLPQGIYIINGKKIIVK